MKKLTEDSVSDWLQNQNHPSEDHIFSKEDLETVYLEGWRNATTYAKSDFEGVNSDDIKGDFDRWYESCFVPKIKSKKED